MSGFMENCENLKKLHRVGCGNVPRIAQFFQKIRFHFIKKFNFLKKKYGNFLTLPQQNFATWLGFLAIFHTPWVPWGVWKIAKPFKNCTWWSVKLLVWVRQLHATHWDHTDTEWKIYIDLLPLRNRCGQWSWIIP